ECEQLLIGGSLGEFSQLHLVARRRAEGATLVVALPGEETLLGQLSERPFRLLLSAARRIPDERINALYAHPADVGVVKPGRLGVGTPSQRHRGGPRCAGHGPLHAVRASRLPRRTSSW